MVVRKRLSRKIFVVKKSIKAGKVHRTGILKLLNTYIPVLCTSYVICILLATNINGALHLKKTCFVLLISNVIEPIYRYHSP